LKQKGTTHVIVVGLLATTSIASTARFAMELGYHVAVRDATAAFLHEMMHAAHELNGPTYAHSILTTAEVTAALPKAAHSKENVQ
jgi:nicotinamidase-related amidase